MRKRLTDAELDAAYEYHLSYIWHRNRNLEPPVWPESPEKLLTEAEFGAAFMYNLFWIGNRETENPWVWSEVLELGEFLVRLSETCEKRKLNPAAIADGRAYKFMEETDDGKISVHRLAETAVDRGLAARKGDRGTKIQRLERFYVKWRIRDKVYKD
jgi:hypothetical protein